MGNIETILQERRVFPPSAEFVKQANVSGMDAYRALCAEAEQNFTGFWARLAREHLEWSKPFTQVLDESKRPIPGLYAAGNDALSIMGGNYPGPGITLGPAMTFGWIAGRHLAGKT